MIRPGKLWTICAASVFAAVIVVSPVCGQGTAQAQGPRTVRLQLKWKHQFQFAGYYAAVEQGYYRDAGLDVQILELEDGQDPLERVLGGHAEFGIGNSELVLHRARGKPIVLLASVFQHSPLVFVAMQDSGISSIHDLAGRRVAVERQAAELLAYLKYEGVPLASIDRQPHAYSPRPLLEGKIDAMSAYSTDEVFLLRESGRPYLIFNPRAGGIDFYGDSLFTTEALTSTDAVLARAFTEASLRGWRYALRNPEETVELIRARYSKRHSVEHLRFEAHETERLILPDIVEPGYTNRGPLGVRGAHLRGPGDAGGGAGPGRLLLRMEPAEGCAALLCRDRGPHGFAAAGGRCFHPATPAESEAPGGSGGTAAGRGGTPGRGASLPHAG